MAYIVLDLKSVTYRVTNKPKAGDLKVFVGTKKKCNLILEKKNRKK
jgi:hypothetical protein